MSRASLILLIASFGLAIIVVSAGSADAPAQGLAQFYVAPHGSDGNDGSSLHPWATITHAGRSVSAGATVHVLPGAYDETVVTMASGTRAARIVYISDRNSPAVIAPVAHGVIAWKNLGDYTDIIGFQIAGSDCHGIGLGGSFQRAIWNDVHNSAAGCNTNPGSGSGIDDLEYASRDNDIIANFVHNVGVGDSLCGQQGHDLIQGIYQANAGGHIHGNISANNCGFGIHLWHAATHAVITNNTIVRNRSGGILVGSGDAPCTSTGCPGGDDFTIVLNNIVGYNGNASVKGWGIVEYAEKPGLTGNHNEYMHNLSFANTGGDFNLDNHLLCLACIRGEDPLFVGLASLDLHLRTGSPALGRGATHDLSFDSLTGIHQSDRPPDIGAMGSEDAATAR